MARKSALNSGALSTTATTTTAHNGTKTATPKAASKRTASKPKAFAKASSPAKAPARAKKSAPPKHSAKTKAAPTLVPGKPSNPVPPTPATSSPLEIALRDELMDRISTAQRSSGKSTAVILANMINGYSNKDSAEALFQEAIKKVAVYFATFSDTFNLKVSFSLSPLPTVQLPEQVYEAMLRDLLASSGCKQAELWRRMGFQSANQGRDAFFPRSPLFGPQVPINRILAFLAETGHALMVSATPGAAAALNSTLPQGPTEEAPLTTTEQLESLLRQAAGLSPETPDTDATSSAGTIRNATLALGRYHDLPEGLIKLATRYLDIAVSARDLGLSKGLDIAFSWAETFAAHAHAVITACQKP